VRRDGVDISGRSAYVGIAIRVKPCYGRACFDVGFAFTGSLALQYLVGSTCGVRARGSCATAVDDEAAESEPAKGVRKRRHRASKPQLISRHTLDRRTNAARTFDRLVADIESDLGGSDHLSAIQRQLIEAFAGSAVLLDSLNTAVLCGRKVAVGEHSVVASTMVRIAARLGLRRRPRDVTPTVDEYLASKQKGEGA
jgi:hypothetical protein